MVFVWIDYFERVRNCYLEKERCHFEWVWDGNSLWLVQKDIEKIDKGSKPGSNWKYEDLKISTENLQVLKIDNHATSK